LSPRFGDSSAVREKGYSQRRACRLVGLHPKTYRYAPKRSGDEELRQRLRELASQRRRFGYRRLGLMLERQGIKLNAKKLYRLYKEERLTVRKRGGPKRALGTRAPMAVPQDRNLRWSLDFVADTLASGRRFRILTLVDDFTRECLGLVADTSLTGLRVARELDRIAELRGYPCMIVSDNGTELTSNAISRRLVLVPDPKNIKQPVTTRLNILPHQAPIFLLNSFTSLRVDRSSYLSE
jgi:putative transposase